MYIHVCYTIYVLNKVHRRKQEMKKELEKVLEIVEKFNNGERISFEEVKTLAYTDISELDTEEWNSVDDTLSYILKEYGEEWSEYDDNFPNNTYRYGYVLEGHTFITSYTGIADRYWIEETGMLCE